MRICVTQFAIILATILAPSLSLGETVFASNFDVVLTIGVNQYRAQSRARVADGHVIPIEFQRYRVDLKVSSLEADNFQTIVTIFERIDGDWLQMDADPGGFGGRIGAPLQFSWNGDGMRLNIAFIVSKALQK